MSITRDTLPSHIKFIDDMSAYTDIIKCKCGVEMTVPVLDSTWLRNEQFKTLLNLYLEKHKDCGK